MGQNDFPHSINGHTEGRLKTKFVLLTQYLLMNTVIPIQVTESKAHIVPMLLDVLSWTAYVSIHTDVV